MNRNEGCIGHEFDQGGLYLPYTGKFSKPLCLVTYAKGMCDGCPVSALYISKGNGGWCHQLERGKGYSYRFLNANDVSDNGFEYEKLGIRSRSLGYTSLLSRAQVH